MAVSRQGDMYENRVTGERAVVLRGDEDRGDAPALVHLTVKSGGAVVGEHVHPRVQERFIVVAGRLGTRLDGVERTLVAGDEATAPAGMPHDWWNAGETDAEVIVELTPPDPRFEAMIATMFGLANDGRTDGRGRPGPLQLALIGREFADVIRFTRPPAVVQRVLFGILGAVGRRRGLRGIYPEYLAPHGYVAPDPDALRLADLAGTTSG
jgi:quercetin dioxygenase-like cupin family protein